MKTKLIVVMALAAGGAVVYSQASPQGMKPPQASSAPSRSAVPSDAALPEALRLLSLPAVQTELAVTSSEWSALNTLASTIRTNGASEDQSLAAVAEVLTVQQSTRLLELLVQDMGYGSLAFSAVRAQLTLSPDQATQIATLNGTYATVKKALATTRDATLAANALTQLRTVTNAGLAKVLTSDQDAKLRQLAGKALAVGS